MVLALILFLLPAAYAAGDFFSPPEFESPSVYSVRAYSEFMPAPRLGVRPYEPRIATRAEILAESYWKKIRSENGGFRVPADEEVSVLRPGLRYLAEHLLEDVFQLASGEAAGGPKLRGLPASLLSENPYWSELPPARGPWVMLTALALTKTQDDRGRAGWTVLPAPEDESFFWRSLPEDVRAWWLSLLTRALGHPVRWEKVALFSERAPAAMADRKWDGRGAPEVLITFRPISEWPAKLRERYLAGETIVVPHPLTRLFAGAPLYRELARERTEAADFARLWELSQFGQGSGLRVPRLRPLSSEENWLRRRHRFSGNSNAWEEDLDSLGVSPFAWLFDPIPEVIGLYGKPAARNAQVWAVGGPLAGKWILDGNSADRAAIARARETIVLDRGRSRLQMREVLPPMEVNGQSVVWHRPWIAWRADDGKVVVDYSLLGEVKAGGTRLAPRIETLPPPRELVPLPIAPLTFADTVEADEGFEKRYWQYLTDLTQPALSAKNNVDCVDNEVKDKHCEKSQLPQIGAHLLAPYYAGLGLGLVPSPFRWEIDYDIPWWGGLRTGEPQKNYIVVIPGTGDHSEAIWMADHYDTAYMEDIYHGTADPRLKGHHHSAPGADDNASATAALMEAARVLPKLKLKRDVWLVHLTGEEFPADCLGARALVEKLVKGEAILAGRKNPKVVGVYLLDMIAHNTDRDKVAAGRPSASIFQLSTGRGSRAERLAEIAAGVAKRWNQSTRGWNERFARRPFWERSATRAPKQGQFPSYRAELRRPEQSRSTLYNTDGQIFSDAGVPVVLFMENYVIDRVGYHDTQDTLANIDLDYGAGIARIAIESVAQAAND